MHATVCGAVMLTFAAKIIVVNAVDMPNGFPLQDNWVNCPI